jgi:hypothetical protein
MSDQDATPGKSKRVFSIISKPVVIEVEPYGKLELRILTAGDFDLLAELLQEPLSPRQILVKLVFYQLEQPELELETVITPLASRQGHLRIGYRQSLIHD